MKVDSDKFAVEPRPDGSSVPAPFAGLPKHMRLTIYNYLDLKTVASQISRVSVKEREILRTSAIARKGRHFRISSAMISNEQSLFPKYGLHLFESLELDVDQDVSCDITSLVMNMLPSRFHERCLSLRFY